VFTRDLEHFPEWTFDGKRISANSKPLTSTLILTLKHNNLFGKTKWRHFPASVQIRFTEIF